MSTLIGEWSDTRPTCDEVHIPAVYNPWLDLTACLCGDQWLPGDMDTLHWRSVDQIDRDPLTGRPVYRRLGYDVYWLPASEGEA